MIKPYINLGKQPKHANGFLTPEEFGKEEFFNMEIGFDQETKAVRLMEPCARELMFNDHYAFFSKTSQRMIRHFAETARHLMPFVKRGVVVEIGSNDGIMQDAWRDLGIKCIGVDPSANVAAEAQSHGHEVVVDFMSEKVADYILDGQRVDLVYGANVSCHITDIDGYFAAIAKLIDNTGVFVFEDPYFLDVYEKCSYDQFYGEHTWMFTVQFLSRKLAEFGLEIFDIKRLWVHGGSMRYYVAKKGTQIVNGVVAQQIVMEGDIEHKLGELASKIENSKMELYNLLESLKGKKICGFGATSKGVVITNFCGIGPDLIPFITDTTPMKIGKYYPGSHIEIRSQADIDYSQFDYIINFAWNHFEEIRKSRPEFKGKWITHVPYPRIIDA